MDAPADVPPYGAENISIFEITPSNSERISPEPKRRSRPHSLEVPPLQKNDSKEITAVESRPISPLALVPPLQKNNSKENTPKSSRPNSPLAYDRKERSGSESSASSNHHNHGHFSGHFFKLKSPTGHVLHSDNSTIDQLFSTDSQDEETKHDAELSPQTQQPSPLRPLIPPSISTSHSSPRMEDYSEHHHILNTINEDEGESSILQDIERKANFGGLGSGSGGTISDLAGYNTAKTTVTSNNTASTPNAAPFNRGRTFSALSTHNDNRNSINLGRKNSLDSQEYILWDNINTPLKGLRYIYVHLMATLRYLTPGLSHRINVYFMLFFLLVIAMVAQKNRPYLKMLELYACTIALELATSMFDRLIYFAIDMVFISRFDIAYQLHSLNGPIGYLVAIFIMRSFWGFLEPVMIFKDWNSFLNSAAVLIICLVAKNWLIRKQYVQLLETRFTSKVENLNTMIIILSELASTRPPRTAKLVRSNSSIHSSIKAIPTSSDNLAAGASHLADTITSKVKNVFAEIVENTAEEEEHEEVITRRELYQKQRHFWQSAARLNATAGRMKVITYNGVVNIHNQNQAKEFGRKLYKHLSKGGKVVITPELIRRLFEERCEIVNRDLDEKADHDLEMQKVASKPASSALYQSNGEISDLWSKAVTMFDPFSLGRISEDFCAEAVLNIYKEQRFTAASISDFGELHQSLRIGIDIVYWLVMLMVLQSTLGFDVASYLLPFVTLLLSFSFAIASLVGNVFLAMAFVFFMSPYEVGHKVQIGLVSSSVPPPLGFIKSVSLLYTVINTTKNETIKIPNHSLWNEKIYNLSETTGATHEFAIVFNINGSEGSDAEKIKLFFTRLKHFTLRESKEWKSFFLAVFSMSIPDNTIEYRVYCSHREGWGLTQGVAVAKIDYYAQIKKLREDLNLYFVKADMPVLLSSHTHAHSSEHHKHFHGHSANTSVMSSPADSPREGRERSVNVDPENPPPLPDPDMLAHRHIPAALLSDSYSTKSEGNGRRKVGSPSSKKDSDGRRKSTGKKDK